MASDAGRRSGSKDGIPLRAAPAPLARRFDLICASIIAEALAASDIVQIEFAALVFVADVPGIEQWQLAAAVGIDRNSASLLAERLARRDAGNHRTARRCRHGLGRWRDQYQQGCAERPVRDLRRSFDPAGIGPVLAKMPLAQRFVQQAYRHGKPIAVAPDCKALLEAVDVWEGDGVTIGDDDNLLAGLLESLAQHRFPLRNPLLPRDR